MKRAIITLTPQALRDLLQLPKEAVFEEVRIPFSRPGVLEVKLSGVGWETPEGCSITKANAGVVTTREDGSFEIDWRLP